MRFGRLKRLSRAGREDERIACVEELDVFGVVYDAREGVLGRASPPAVVRARRDIPGAAVGVCGEPVRVVAVRHYRRRVEERAGHPEGAEQRARHRALVALAARPLDGCAGQHEVGVGERPGRARRRLEDLVFAEEGADDEIVERVRRCSATKSGDVRAQAPSLEVEEPRLRRQEISHREAARVPAVKSHVRNCAGERLVDTCAPVIGEAEERRRRQRLGQCADAE